MSSESNNKRRICLSLRWTANSRIFKGSNSTI